VMPREWNGGKRREELGSEAFDYSFIGCHRGLLGGVAFPLIVFAIVVFGALSGRTLPGGDSVVVGGVLLGLSVITIAMGFVGDRMNRVRLGKVVTSDAGVRFERRDGETIELPWDQMQSCILFSPSSPLGEAGGAKGGIRMASPSKAIVIYKHIRGWSRLRQLIEQRARVLGVWQGA